MGTQQKTKPPIKGGKTTQNVVLAFAGPLRLLSCLNVKTNVKQILHDMLP